MEGAAAAFSIAGFQDAYAGAAIGSGSDSDYEDVLRSPHTSSVALAPGADLKLARLQSEHALSMMELRHEKEANELRQDVRRLQRQLRSEVRRRDKAIATLVDERDEALQKLSAVASELSAVSDKHAAIRRADSKRKEQLAALRAQAASDASAHETSTAALRERLDEAAARATAFEKTAAELRKELEAANLANQDLKRSVNEGREALERAWLDASSAVAAKDVLAERVSMHERELKRLEEGKWHAEESAQARAEELREACAALATAREQRNQAAREADLCRATAEEAREDLAAGEELVTATEGRVDAAERKAAQEGMARQRAEEKLEAAAVQQAVARSARQRRMLVVLIRTTRTLRAVGFARWLAAAAAIDALAAADARREATVAAVEMAKSCHAANETLAARDVALAQASHLGAAWISSIDCAVSRLDAAEAFGRWTSCTRAQLCCEARWERVVRAACLAADRRAAWRTRLRGRVARVHASPADASLRRFKHAYDARRIGRIVFTLWRLHAQGAAARGQCAFAEARYAPLHVSPAPWYT